MFRALLANKLQDEYGGDRENRSRFSLEIVEGIKHCVGLDFPVMVRLAAEDVLERSRTLGDGCWQGRSKVA